MLNVEACLVNFCSCSSILRWGQDQGSRHACLEAIRFAWRLKEEREAFLKTLKAEEAVLRRSHLHWSHIERRK